MSKENILKKFDIEFGTFKFHDNDCVEHDEYDIRYFLSNAIDQTREETIRDVEEGLPNKEDDEDMYDIWSDGFNKGFNKCLKQIKQSLINLRK